MKRIIYLAGFLLLSVALTGQGLTGTDIKSYSFPEQASPAVIDTVAHTVDIDVDYGTDVTNLVATFTLSDSATAYVDSVEQISGTTVNDFTNPVDYKVVAEDTSISQLWTVNVTEAPNTETNFLSYSLPGQTGAADIDTIAHNIDVEVVHGTPIDSLVATFTLSDSATAYVDSVEQISGTTVNDFTNPVDYKVVAEDTSVSQVWTVNVTETPNTETDFLNFSFPQQAGPAVIDTASHSITIDVLYGTDKTSLVADFELSDGATAYISGVEQIPDTTVNDFTSPVIYNVVAEDTAYSQDWVVLVEDGTPNTDAKILSYSFPQQTGPATIKDTTGTVKIEVELGTKMDSLIANFSLSTGATAYIDTIMQQSGVTVNDFTDDTVQYKIVAQDTTFIRYWDVIVTEEPNVETEFLSYSLPDQTGPAVIDTVANTIDVEVAYGTDVTDMVAEFTLSEGATAKVNNFPQESGVSNNNFSDTVFYDVYAEAADSITEEWAVNVTMQPGADILAFSFIEQTEVAVFDTSAFTIDIDVRTDVDKSSLIAIFSLNQGASATVNGVVQQSGYTINDFTSPVTYTVVNADSTITNKWTVNVSGGVGIEEIEEFNLSVYPNPATAGFYLKMNNPDNSKVDIALISNTGRIIKKTTIENSTQINERIDLNGISSGIYNVRISSGDKVIIKKLSVK